MRLVTYVAGGRTAVGVIKGDGVVDVAAHMPDAPKDLRGLLAGDWIARLSSLASAETDFGLSDVKFAPVVPNPEKIFLVLLNYESDRIAQGRPKLAFPHLMARFADSQVGHRQPLVIPGATQEFDFEGELAVVMGAGGWRIPVERALEHVAGYSCYNDCGARDFMRHTRHFTAGKNFPASAGFGPWLTTVDEVPDLSKATLTTRLNGEVYQTGTPADLTYPISELIAYISSFTPLYPGDVIATGSPGGAGHARTPPRFLKPGDVVEVEIDGIGLLNNPCVAEAA
ncbi:fumarylacetoacetate hydrolase family protein [Phenylobacterium sp.]|uniref:fumarylacetoacetate hydrolase family protein n=1 Tax=Phenylobacterium sp. TaxID=1871053 RepID=UPI0035B4B4FC